MKIRFTLEKIKEYYSKPPEYNFWYYVSIILILRSYVLKNMIWATIFSASLLAPDADIRPTVHNASVHIAQAYEIGFNRLVESGQDLGRANPALAPHLAAMISFGVTYSLYLIGFYLFYGLLRHLVYWIVNHRKKSS